jgi:histidine triad (HIT) family protein
MMSDCVFCRIVSGELPSVRMYEDECCVAFLDVNPRSEGHTLVVPRKHVKVLDELGDEGLCGLFVAVGRVVKLLEKLEPAGYNVMSNNGEVAGQVVPHVHVHVIPRYEGAQRGVGMESVFPVDEAAKERLEEIGRLLKR